MTSRFKKLASATAVAAALAGVGLPAGAAVLGGAGEALLVPLAVWSNGQIFPGIPPAFPGDPDARAPGYTPAVDTLIELWVPGAIGFDAIPNIYTAQNTTPTNNPTALDPSDPDLTDGSANLKWYWFNKRSGKLRDGQVPVTPNDVVQISLTQVAGGSFENVPGYFVVVNQSATNGDSADFSIFGNAWLTGAFRFPILGPPGIGFPLIGASIPVLAMNDGEDDADDYTWNPVTRSFDPGADGIPDDMQPDKPYVTASAIDSVKYSQGTPYSLSPVIPGFRTNRSDGDEDSFVFDLALSNRLVPTIQVIWLDHNLGPDDGVNNGNGQVATRPLDVLFPPLINTATPSEAVSLQVYDTDEDTCSSGVNLPNELNVLWVPPAYDRDVQNFFPWNTPFAWTTGGLYSLCIPSDPTQPIDNTALWNSGFVEYIMYEYIDTDIDRAESAAFGFSIKVDGGFVDDLPIDGIPTTFVLALESSLGHDRGTFKNASPPPKGQ